MSVTIDKGPSEPGPDAPEELPDGRRSRARRLVDAYLYGQTWVVTLLAFICALAFGALLIAVADAPTRRASHYFFQHPTDTLSAAWGAISAA